MDCRTAVSLVRLLGAFGAVMPLLILVGLAEILFQITRSWSMLGFLSIALPSALFFLWFLLVAWRSWSHLDNEVVRDACFSAGFSAFFIFVFFQNWLFAKVKLAGGFMLAPMILLIVWMLFGYLSRTLRRALFNHC